MHSIKMVDLHGQYTKIKAEIDQAIQKVIDNTSFVKGEDVQLFEAELGNYLGIDHVIACANGTDALQIALMALDLKPGDEVITADFTFIATAEVIALLGLKPVLVDVDPETFLIDTQLIEKNITPRTKAIIPVHLFGQIANMDEIMRIAQKHRLFVIEDNAQAIGADYYGSINKKAGTIGHIGCTSFFPSKNLGCFGDGGALFTNDEKLATRIRSVANHGMTRRYYHDDIGINSRLDGIQAAILRVKLKYLDDYNSQRANAASIYDSLLGDISEITVPNRTPLSNHIFHQYTLKGDGFDREAFIQFLKEKGVPCMIYYPVPLHMQKAYLHYDFDNNAFPVTDALCKTVFSLPMHTELTLAEQTYMANCIKEFFLKA
jgi:dTDP-4-amino-4,6-dideoxygalactose transaminase